MRLTVSTFALCPFVLASLVQSGCTDPCDGDDAFIGDIVLRQQADLEELRGKRCVTGAIDIGIAQDELGDATRANGQVTTLEALSALEVIEGHLYIQGTCGLADLSGLENVVYVGRELKLVGNNNVFVRGELWIRSNGDLMSIAALSSLEHVGGGFLVEDNPLLPEDDVRQLREQLKVHGTRGTEIDNNGGGDRICG